MQVVHRAHRWGRVAVAMAAVLVLAVLVATVLTYGPQIASYVTHIGGSATNTEPLPTFGPGEAPLLRIAAAGDVGSGGDRARRTADAIAEAGSAHSYDELLLLGDNVYPVGDPDLLADRVFDPFAPVLDQGTGLLAILGNHDVKSGRGDEMMAELGMPGRWWAERNGDVLVIGLDSTTPDDQDQLDWLAATLESSTARWTVVALHHPPYSAGYQGSSLDVRAAFTPLFERYDVDLVLSGHEHDYERSKPINGVTYVVSGGAAETRRTGKDDFTVVAVSWHHFVEIDVFSDRMIVRAVNQKLRMFDEFVLH